MFFFSLRVNIEFKIWQNGSWSANPVCAAQFKEAWHWYDTTWKKYCWSEVGDNEVFCKECEMTKHTGSSGAGGCYALSHSFTWCKSTHGTVSNQVLSINIRIWKRPELAYPYVPSKTNTKIWYYNCLRVWACSYQSQLQIFHRLLVTGLDTSWPFPYSTLQTSDAQKYGQDSELLG